MCEDCASGPPQEDVDMALAKMLAVLEETG
jgi:hypothetical protein